MRFTPNLLMRILVLCLGCLISTFSLAQQTSAISSQNLSTINLPVKDIERLATAIAQIKRYYIEPIDDQKLFTYAIEGMLSNLDPHSDYLDADALKELEMTTTGRFAGIGIEVVPENGLIKIISPIDGTPAFKAGIKPGDLIVRINNKLVGDMTLRSAINEIRGVPHTTVHLTIVRKDVKKPLEFTIPREVIKIQTVKTQLYDGKYGYIRLSFFQSETKRDLLQHIDELKEQAKGNLAGVVIDLRNNPGGLLDAAVDVTNLFLNSKHLKYDGLIVYTKGRIPSSDIKAVANGNDILNGIPMVVIINGGSASASEIVAGALQDQNRATVIGERSFGKGSVQTVLPVGSDAMIKLTTALYYTPSGRSIQAKGIQPEIPIADLQIPKATNSDDGLLSISEADLSKHLIDGTDTKETKSATPDATKTTSSQDLLSKDFQLFEALNILKGLAIYKATQQ